MFSHDGGKYEGFFYTWAEYRSLISSVETHGMLLDQVIFMNCFSIKLSKKQFK